MFLPVWLRRDDVARRAIVVNKPQGNSLGGARWATWPCGFVFHRPHRLLAPKTPSIGPLEWPLTGVKVALLLGSQIVSR
jgi:hypothetical protein